MVWVYALIHLAHLYGSYYEQTLRRILRNKDKTDVDSDLGSYRDEETCSRVVIKNVKCGEQ